MKKVTSILLFAATAAALVSCNKEIEKPETLESDGIKITVVAGNPETKTTLESNGKTVSWNATDKVGFFNHTAGVNVESSAAAIDGEGKATFTATVPSAGTYYAYYPYSNADDTSYPAGTDGVTVRIPNEQSPTSASTFDPKADVLLSTDFSATGETTPADICFKRLGAFLKVSFVDGTTGTVLSGEKAVSVAVQGENNLVGRCRVSKDGLAGPLSGYKKVTANYTTDFALTSDAAYLGIIPQTLAKDSELIITVETAKYKISKTVSLPKDITLVGGNVLPLNITLTDAEVTAKVLTVERLWGYYPNTGWPTSFVPANADRGVATDGENVYVTNTTDGTVVGIKIADQSTVTVNMTGVDGGFYKTCSAKTIYNPATGKYILLVGSLAYDTDCNFNVYAWKDGIDQAPTKIISWNTNNGSPRRVGDFFTVSGDWSNGEIWARINQTGAATTFVWKITEGVAGGVLGGGIGYAGSAGMGSVYKYSIDAPQVMVVTPDIAKFYTCKVESTWINANSDGIEWTDGSDVSAYAKRFGYTPFEFNGKKYIAYLHMYNAARGWLTILNDTQGTAEGFMQTIIDNDIYFQGAVQINKDEASTEVVAGATYSENVMANCSVAVMEDHVIIVGHQQNTGLAVFKMYMK